MNKRIKITIGIGLTVLLLAAVFATAAFAQGPGGQGSGGMMGGQGSGGTVPAGCPMFGGAAIPANAQPITFNEAVEAVQKYLKSYISADPSAASGQVLALAEVMEFDNNFYAVVTNKSTGAGAFELLVNRYTGYVTPEPGPNMMWNTQYGHMAGFGGMMSRLGGQQQGSVTLTVAQARIAAQQWLDANQPGAKLADDEMQFPGYYTTDFLKDGKVAGMLSVNGYTGQVWYHTWHGNFIGEKEF
jgi:hypothetical protein